MTIISPLPFAITNGTTADASEVMANLDQIRNDVNSNATTGGGLGNVSGPASAVDGHIAVFDGITGKIIKDSGVAGALSYRGASLNDNSGQSWTGSAKLTFSTVLIDTNSIYSGGAPTRLTVPSGVTKARFIGCIHLNVVAGTLVALKLMKNNVLLDSPLGIFYRQIFDGGGDGITLAITSVALPVTPGDYFELSVGTSPSVSCNTFATTFEMQILG